MNPDEQLYELSLSLMLSGEESKNIDDSLALVFANFKTWKYSSAVKDIKIFGSYARHTLLPRAIDSQSDVDILVVFRYDYRTTSESYFGLLEDFATTYYSEEVILRDDPCIVLNLQGIKIEMTPTIEMGSSINRQIPNYDKRTNKLLEWTFTNPFEVIDMTLSRERQTNSLYLPMVRLLKYWNVMNGKYIKTFKLEGYLSTLVYPSRESLFENLSHAVRYMSKYLCDDQRVIIKLKDDINLIEHFVKYGNPFRASVAIDSIFPKLSLS